MRAAGQWPLADEIEFFATIGRRRTVPRGVALIRRGAPMSEVHLIERGALALIGEHDGRRPIVAFAVRREVCGPVPALLHEPAPWDAVTVMDSSVMTMPAARFTAAVRDRWVDRWTTRTLSWLAEVGERIADIDGRDLDAQVAALLLRNPGEFSVGLCRRTISDLLDIDDVTTRRVVDDLERIGAVQIIGDRISVAHPEVLRKVFAVRRPGATAQWHQGGRWGRRGRSAISTG